MKALGYITLSEAEKLSGIKADTIKKRCQEGNIPGAIKQGKTWFIPRNHIIKEQYSPLDDRLLTTIATFAEAGVGTGITLFVGGSIIVGNLIPAKIYLEKLKSSLKDSPQKETADQKIFDSFDLVFDSMINSLPKNTEELLNRPIIAVHLDKVAFQVGGMWTTPNNAVIRIKLNAIDGFLWGREDNS